jgi:hypothetical protein
MLISTALCISPAPYAGITRFRFDGFAANRRVSGPKDHPKDLPEV